MEILTPLEQGCGYEIAGLVRKIGLKQTKFRVYDQGVFIGHKIFAKL